MSVAEVGRRAIIRSPEKEKPTGDVEVSEVFTVSIQERTIAQRFGVHVEI